MKYVPEGIRILSQGEIVAESLAKYLLNHPEMEVRCTKNGTRKFYTTDSEEDFDNHASIFFGAPVKTRHVEL
jgi:glutamate racemase